MQLPLCNILPRFVDNCTWSYAYLDFIAIPADISKFDKCKKSLFIIFWDRLLHLGFESKHWIFFGEIEKT